MVGWSMSAKTKWWTYSQVWWLNRRIFGLETRISQKTRGDLRLLSVHPRSSHCLIFMTICCVTNSKPQIQINATPLLFCKWKFWGFRSDRGSISKPNYFDLKIGTFYWGGRGSKPKFPTFLNNFNWQISLKVAFFLPFPNFSSHLQLCISM